MRNDALNGLPRLGPLAVIDFVRSPSHEARLAYPSLAADVARRNSGRLRWAGSIDQQLIGHGHESFEDVLISEYPSGEACTRALAERLEWKPESFVSELSTWAARPWPRWRHTLARGVMSLARLRGGAPEALDGPPPPVLEAMAGATPHDPDPTQLATLADADREGRVVMLNFLRFAPEAVAHDDEPGGAAAYAAYGRTAAPLIGRLGGRIRFGARMTRLLSGGPEAAWDEVVAVEYPSRGHFLGMLADARYQAVVPLRVAGLDSTRLFACTSHAAFF